MAWCKKIGNGGGNLVPAMWAPFVYRHLHGKADEISKREYFHRSTGKEITVIFT